MEYLRSSPRNVLSLSFRQNYLLNLPKTESLVARIALLTRLVVRGFKNLDSVDLHFGPFTCLAGDNGVGKSNIFDAISFLSALASQSLTEAASRVRGLEGRKGDALSLFRSNGQEKVTEMFFQTEFIIPSKGEDDLGSLAEASMTYLKYTLRLRYRHPVTELGPLEIVEERLSHINKTDAKSSLKFPHSTEWRESVISGRRTVPYIETIVEGGKGVILTRADSKGGKGGGNPRRSLATNMPRTALSTANNAAEHRTLVLARREMMGWSQIQLEPSALRAPDHFSAPRRLSAQGAHIPATLHALGQEYRRSERGAPEDLYQDVANRLSQLYQSVRTIRIDVDERREQYMIVLEDLLRAEHLASSLSDGTLRFLALAILEVSPTGPSVLCFEEPENGIHPARVPAMVGLLQDLCVDTKIAVDAENVMRQVIINTHSPAVAQSVPEDALVIVEVRARGPNGPSVEFVGPPGTWRQFAASKRTLDALAPYFRPPSQRESSRGVKTVAESAIGKQLLLLLPPEVAS